MFQCIDELKELLKENVVSVEFWKNNGDRRVMECTLNPALIVDYKPHTGPETESTAISVYVPEFNHWRSFRKDSLLSYRVVKS